MIEFFVTVWLRGGGRTVFFIEAANAREAEREAASRPEVEMVVNCWNPKAPVPLTD